MNPLKYLTIFFTSAALLFSCNDDDVGAGIPQGPEEDYYKIVIQSESTAPPSKVSVFYRVEDIHGEPVSDLQPEDFSIYEKGRNDEEFRPISKDEADRIIGDNENVFAYNLMMLLDLSASVTNNHLEEIKTSASKFVHNVLGTNINSSTKVAIYWFDGADQLHELIEFTNVVNDLDDAIADISQNMSFDNSTDLFGAIIKGTDLTQGKIEQANISGLRSAGAILTFTDGTDQAARYTKEEAFQKINLHQDRINYYTIGLGSEIDQEILDKIGKKESILANNEEELTLGFDKISNLIYKEVNSFYLFEYCSPKRDGSGINELRIELIIDDQKGIKDTNFDATGFRSGCELN